MSCACAHDEHGWRHETPAMRALLLVSDCLVLAQKDDDDEQRRRMRKLLRIEQELAQGSAEEWDRRSARALEALGRMVSRKPAVGRAILRTIARHYGELDEALRPLYEDKLGLAYGLGRDGVAADLKQSVTFNTVDKQAQGWLVDHHLYWVGQAYDREFSGRIARIVDEQVVSQGLSYQAAAKVLQEQLGPELAGSKPLAYWEVVANAAAVRSRSFGAVESFVQGGVTVVEILNPEDEATCPTCSHLSGQRFEIAQVVGQRNAMMAAATPEEAKEVAPWRPPAEVVGKGAAELAGQGTVLPPYHGRCRCTANAWVEEGAPRHLPTAAAPAIPSGSSPARA
jgi:hypothetical protein